MWNPAHKKDQKHKKGDKDGKTLYKLMNNVYMVKLQSTQKNKIDVRL